MLVLIFYLHYSNIANGYTGAFTVNDSPYGTSYDIWTQRWWKWALAFPQDQNPMFDDSGRLCGNGQNYSDVWFLAGNAGGSSERTCTIPSGKAILVPLINAECSKAEEPLKPESDLLPCATEYIDTARNLVLKVDGIKIDKPEQYRVNSGGIFNVFMPVNNIYSVSVGNTSAASDGYWVFLKPLPEGEHTIEFSAQAGCPDPTCQNPLVVSVTYHLSIKAQPS